MMSQNEQDRFYRANVASQLIPQLIAHENVADALYKANQLVAQITFGYALIDRPEHGFNMHFIITNDSGGSLPGDGYNWMDDEMTISYPIDPARHLIVNECKKGVVPGEQFTSMTRKRYQLFVNQQPLQIQFIHYLALDASARVHILPGAPIRYMARRVPAMTYDQMQKDALQEHQRLVAGNALNRSTPNNSGPPPLKFTGTGLRNTVPSKRSASVISNGSGTQMNSSSTSRRKLGHQDVSSHNHHINSSSTSTTTNHDRNFTYHLDETPTTTNRDIAIIRFARNHQWLESLWTPLNNFALNPSTDFVHSTTNHKPDSTTNENNICSTYEPSSNKTDKLTSWKNRITELRSEISVLEQSPNIIQVPKFPGSVRQWQGELNGLTTLNAWTSYINDVANIRANESDLGHICPYSAVRIIELNGITSSSSSSLTSSLYSPTSNTDELPMTEFTVSSTHMQPIHKNDTPNSNLLDANIDGISSVVPNDSTTNNTQQQPLSIAPSGPSHSPSNVVDETQSMDLNDYLNMGSSSSSMGPV